MKKANVIFIHFILLSVFNLQGQEIISISKAEVLNKVLGSNQDIKISEQDFFKAQADYRQTNAVFLPNITLGYTGISTTNPLMAFGSKLNQETLTASDFDPIFLNNPSRTQNFATSIEIIQPLINADGIYQRKAAKIKMEATSLKRQRTNDFYMLEVNNAYMQLQLAYKAVTVLETALRAANANKALAENSFNQGYLQRADVLNVDVRVTEVQNQLQQAKSNVLNASNYLSFLINETTHIIYKPSDSLALETLMVKDKTISEKRSDIKAMALVSTAYRTMNKADKMAFLPRLNAFGSYEIYDDQILQGKANGYVVGAQLTWNIFQGSKQIGKVQKSKAEYNKSKLEYEQYVSQSKLEFNQATRNLIDTENKLKLTRLALEHSEEVLRIRTNRFKEGLEKTSDLLIAETQYARKQLEYYQTVFEFNYAQAYLEFLTKE